jgi:hypothetical protein
MKTETKSVLDSMELFDSTFKYQVGQQLRHRGDTKDYSTDMGLLVLSRIMIESKDDDNSVTYRREYHCRVVRFSGSGDVMAFKEHELMTIEEYTTQNVKDEADRNRMRNEVKQVEKEVFEVFGVTPESKLFLKDASGNVDKSAVYRPTGFEFKEGTPGLHLTEVLTSLGKKVDHKRVTVHSKDQFEVIQ